MRLLITLVSSLLFAASTSAQNRYVYLNNQSQPNALSAFQINADGSLAQITGSPLSTGGKGYASPMESMADISALTEVPGSPFGANANINGLNVTASGKFLLAAGNSNEGVQGPLEVFAISSTGAITQVPGSPFAPNAGVSDIRSNCASDRVFNADNGSAYDDAYTML
jgi:hypothetical protein